MHCSSNNNIAEDSVGYEPGKKSFQVTSDLEYARVLQRQYDSERSSWDFGTIDRDCDYMVRLNEPLPSSIYDPLPSSLYDPLPHVEHHGIINIPTFDSTPFEE